jgi:hypothetical protein
MAPWHHDEGRVRSEGSITKHKHIDVGYDDVYV